MRAAIFLVAMGALMTAWRPIPANADCGPYSKKVAELQKLKDRVSRELARVNAMKPPPTTDDVLCDAADAFAKQALYLSLAPEPTCFQNKAQIDDFVAGLRKNISIGVELREAVCRTGRH